MATVRRPAKSPKTVVRKSRPQTSSDGSADAAGPKRASKGERDRPVIYYGELTATTRQAWRALRSANDETDSRSFVFLYGDQPSRFEHDDTGRPIPKPLTSDRMRYRLSQIADWATEKDELRGAPREVVTNVLATPDPDLPRVARVTEVPTIAADGSVADEPGYGRNSKVFYAPARGLNVPKVAARPTKNDRRRALSLLSDELLGDFPFVSDAERAHALALTLLPFARDLINGPTPMHLVEAPTPGTGKGLLAQAAMYPTIGRPLSPMVEGGDEDEWRKRITSTLIKSPPAILIDNLQGRLDSAALASALSATEWEDRKLGKSENLVLPNRAVWIATGNNPSLSGEIMRRCVRIRLDAEVEHPEDRKGFRHPDLFEWASENRGDLVWAALTVVRAWVVAGRPAADRKLGTYESWSAVIGGILAAAGVDGFLNNLEALRDNAGSEREAMAAALATWHRIYASNPTFTKQLDDDILEALGIEAWKENAALLAGKALGRHVDRRYGDFVLRKATPQDGRARWKVEEVDA